MLFSARRCAKFYIGCLEPPFGLLSGDPRQLWKLRQFVHCSKGGLDRVATRLLDELNVVIDLCRVRYSPGWRLGVTGGSSSRLERDDWRRDERSPRA